MFNNISPFNASAINRRDLLRIGGPGMLGLTLPKLLQAQDATVAHAPAKTAKSVIFLFQWGGPSHVDTFYMKPDAPDEYRSKYTVQTMCRKVQCGNCQLATWAGCGMFFLPYCLSVS